MIVSPYLLDQETVTRAASVMSLLLVDHRADEDPFADFKDCHFVVLRVGELLIVWEASSDGLGSMGNGLMDIRNQSRAAGGSLVLRPSRLPVVSCSRSSSKVTKFNMVSEEQGKFNESLKSGLRWVAGHHPSEVKPNSDMLAWERGYVSTNTTRSCWNIDSHVYTERLHTDHQNLAKRRHDELCHNCKPV